MELEGVLMWKGGGEGDRWDGGVGKMGKGMEKEKVGILGMWMGNEVVWKGGGGEI